MAVISKRSVLLLVSPICRVTVSIQLERYARSTRDVETDSLFMRIFRDDSKSLLFYKYRK